MPVILAFAFEFVPLALWDPLQNLSELIRTVDVVIIDLGLTKSFRVHMGKYSPAYPE